LKTILVTGGAGFIGSNFVRRIYSRYPDYSIIVLDALTYAGFVENLPCDINRRADPRLKFWYGDVRNAELVSKLVSQSDVVLHFAAETHVTRSIFDNLRFFETDVLGTHVVANAVLSHASRVERFIHISTSEVYGTAQTPEMEENHPICPMSPYASAKAGADRLVYSYWATYKIPAVIIRPFNNYGPCQHLEKVVPRFITSCLMNEPLNVHGGGEAERDWLYVEDLCRALDMALHQDMRSLAGEAINVGTGRSTSIARIAEIICDKMGKSHDLIRYVGERPGQVLRHTSSTAKARELLGWQPETTFEHGLDKTIQWYANNPKWWEKLLWMRHVPIITEDGREELH